MAVSRIPTLGIIFHPQFPPETLRDYARHAESAGFNELWLWDDCFLPGAFTAAAIALAATDHLKVGIGLLPATVYNPLFAAMEITTLARAFPGRFMPGFGHGVRGWMQQIGAYPASTMKTLERTVTVVRDLLRGEKVTVHEHGIDLDDVQMETIPDQVPPLYIGGMREKTLQLAGRVGDGTILTALSAPAYVRWAADQIQSGVRERAPDITSDHRVVVYAEANVNPDGQAAREAVLRTLAFYWPWSDVQCTAMGIFEEAKALYKQHGRDIVPHIPDAWIDDLTVSGTPEQAAQSIERLTNAGADAVILQPQDDNPACLDDYIRYLMPLFK